MLKGWPLGADVELSLMNAPLDQLKGTIEGVRAWPFIIVPFLKPANLEASLDSK